LRKVLLKAWQSYKQFQITDSAKSNNTINWAGAVDNVQAQEEFIPIVTELLQKGKVTPDFQTLKLAVIVFQDSDKLRAIELLQTAQHKLPPDDVSDQKWLYQTWTQLITGKTPEEQSGMKVTDKTQLAALVEMRKDQISYTGSGYADLLGLYWRLGQNDKAAELMKVIQQPGVHAEEKIDVAKVLLMPPQDIAFSKDVAKQMQTQGVDLLQTYLATASQEIP
jgi:hypothetical protein